MTEPLSNATAGNMPSIDDVEREETLMKDFKGIVRSIRALYDMAYDAYLLLVDDICSRESSENEVEHLLDHLLDFAGEGRMLLLYKRVCRKYFYQYPVMVADHIHMWRDLYDEEFEGRNDKEELLSPMH